MWFPISTILQYVFATAIRNCFHEQLCFSKIRNHYDFITNRSEMKEDNNDKVKVGPKPINLTCVHCNTIVKTVVEYEASMMTHNAAIMLIPVLCCCCLPYFCTCCQDVLHYCPKCKEYIDTYRR